MQGEIIGADNLRILLDKPIKPVALPATSEFSIFKTSEEQVSSKENTASDRVM